MKKSLLLAAILIVVIQGFSQSQNFWERTNPTVTGKQVLVNRAQPNQFVTFNLNVAGLSQALAVAPLRGSFSGKSQLVMSFPNPQGKLERFRIMEAPVLHPALGAKYPDIKSYAGQGIDDQSATLRFSISDERGFYGMVLSSQKGSWFIDPFTSDLGTYMIYSKKDLSNTHTDFECLIDETKEQLPELNSTFKATNDMKLRKYRLALSCNAEYGNIFAGTGTTQQKKARILAQMNITMTRVNGIYEKDLAIIMEIVPNNDTIIFFGSTSADPWNGEFNTKTQWVNDHYIGNANYDIGHNFNTSGGGNAGCIACVCTTGHKGSGMTGSSNPTGDAFDIDYVAHEMGHQFGGYHTMNTCSRSGNGISEVEPTSGISIMGYAGICTYNIAAHSDPFFAYVNIRDISANVQTGASSVCPEETDLTNHPPTAEAGANYKIPKSTSFALTGTGSDPDGDELTYCWEQNDPEQSPGDGPPQATWTVGPLFRPFEGTTNPTRYFPKMEFVVNPSSPHPYEVLPSVARTMDFSLTVRDNIVTGGQTANDLMTVTIVGTAGPFLVTAPNTLLTYTPGDTMPVTWNKANTNLAPINCTHVNILLSADGGFTYPDTLVMNTPNDGVDSVIVPDAASQTCRIKIEAADNIFFDISNANFKILGNPIPSAGQDQTICANSTHLAANNPNPLQGTWSIIKGDATFANIHLYNSLITNIAADSNSFVWTIGNLSDTVNIFNHTIYTNAGSDQTINANTVTLAAEQPGADGSGIWSLLSGDGEFTNSSLYNTQVTGITQPVNEYIWTLSQNGCSASDTVMVMFIFAVAGENQELCVDSTILSANNPDPFTGIWSVVEGNAEFADAHDPQTHVGLLDPGSNLLCWTIGDTKDTVSIFNNVVIMDAGTAQNIVDSTTILDATAPQDGGSGIWTLISGDGVFQDSSLYNTEVYGITQWRNVYLWTLSQNGCSASDSVVIRYSNAIETIENSLNFQIVPNPNHGSFEIQLREVKNRNAIVKIYSIQGQLVYQSGFNSVSSKMSIKNLTKGLYMVSVLNGTKEMKTKMVVE